MHWDFLRFMMISVKMWSITFAHKAQVEASFMPRTQNSSEMFYFSILYVNLAFLCIISGVFDLKELMSRFFSFAEKI